MRISRDHGLRIRYLIHSVRPLTGTHAFSLVFPGLIFPDSDTICPWTYLALLRLRSALSQLPASTTEKAAFTIIYKPYQLYPAAPQEGEDKYTWYKKTRYRDSDELMQKYTHVMGSYGEKEGIHFKFGGVVANTSHAHRLIQHFQQEKGPEVADKIVRSLYRQYFEEERHPSSDETLLRAATEAGVDEEEAKAFVTNKQLGLREVEMAVREQAGNQVDAVPFVVIEGKRRDLSLEGAKEVGEYVAALEKVAKESS